MSEQFKGFWSVGLPAHDAASYDEIAVPGRWYQSQTLPPPDLQDLQVKAVNGMWPDLHDGQFVRDHRGVLVRWRRYEIPPFTKRETCKECGGIGFDPTKPADENGMCKTCGGVSVVFTPLERKRYTLFFQDVKTRGMIADITLLEVVAIVEQLSIALHYHMGDYPAMSALQLALNYWFCNTMKGQEASMSNAEGFGILDLLKYLDEPSLAGALREFGIVSVKLLTEPGTHLVVPYTHVLCR